MKCPRCSTRLELVKVRTAWGLSVVWHFDDKRDPCVISGMRIDDVRNERAVLRHINKVCPWRTLPRPLLPERQLCVSGKFKYGTEAEAAEAAWRTTRTNLFARSDKDGCREYQCDLCDGWHVTSSFKAFRPERRWSVTA